MSSRHTYKPEPLNINWFINEHFGPAPRKAFGHSAVIVQHKKIPDVSYYQGAIDWTRMKSLTDALIIRAGQNLWVDIYFRRNWIEAKQAGILRGCYWFYDDRIDPGRQADLLIQLIQDDLPEMEVWIDWERSYGGSYGGLRNVVAMMQKIENTLPVRIGMYTGYYWFRGNSNAIANAAQYAYLKTKPLWLAWYTTLASNVLIPPPWDTLLLWQYGTPPDGPSYGVRTTEIDLSFFNGNDETFYERYTGGSMQIIKGTVLGTIKRRQSPAGTEFNPPRYLYAGDQIEASENLNQWLHLSKINGTPVTDTEWASAGTTQQYIRWSWVTVEEEPPPPVEPTLTHTIQVYSDGSIKIDGVSYP